jgi:hypothetical protein
MSSCVENEAAYEAAIVRNIRNNARKTFMKRDRAAEVVNWIADGRSEFAASLWDAYQTYGKLTDKQFAAVLKCIDTAAAKKAEWEAKRMEVAALGQYVGEAGGKLALENVKVEAVITVAAPRFSYYDRDSQEIYLLRDAAGNRLVFRTKAEVGIAKGDVVNLTAKVKEHKDFRGEKQTVINRAKFAKVEATA